MRFGFTTIRVICITVILSLFSVSLLTVQASVSIIQNDNNISIESSEFTHHGAKNKHDMASYNEADHENTGDHETICDMGVCFSFLSIEYIDVTAAPITDKYVGLPELLLLADGKFELHRPPSA